MGSSSDVHERSGHGEARRAQPARVATLRLGPVERGKVTLRDERDEVVVVGGGPRLAHLDAEAFQLGVDGAERALFLGENLLHGFQVSLMLFLFLAK